MLNPKIEKLKRISSKKRVLNILLTINSCLNKDNLIDISSEYDEIIAISKRNVVKPFFASGSQVPAIDPIYEEFKRILHSRNSEQGQFLISISVDGQYYFDLKVNLNKLNSMIDQLIETFFKKGDTYSDEIIIVKSNPLEGGVGLFIEEHKYYISSW